MNNQIKHLKYRPEIDGLRAIAVVSVILFHAGFKWIGGGFSGVDIFFVISGYLVTYMMVEARANGTFSIREFYERRARRILPALFLVVLGTVPLAWISMAPAEFLAFGKSVMAAATFSSNIYFGLTTSYFDSTTDEKPLVHTWSLGVEEQFYLVCPLVIALIWRYGKSRQTEIFLALGVISLIYAEWALHSSPQSAFYSPLTRSWELLVGAIVASMKLQGDVPRWIGRHEQMLSAVGLLLIFISIFGLHDARFPGVAALLPTVGAGLILAFASSQTAVTRILSNRVLIVIGLMSYSAYLWHQPIFAFARLHFQTTELAHSMSWMLVLLSFVLAYPTWRYIETYFRNSRQVARKGIVTLTSIGTATMVAVGAVTIVANGFPNRFDAARQKLLETAVFSSKRDACHTWGKDFKSPSAACTYFKDNVTWAVIGDSHAVEPAYALAEALAMRDQGLLHLTFSACAPAARYESPAPGCSKWQREAITRIEQSPHIKNVLVAFRYSMHLFGDHLPGYPAIPDRPLHIGGLDTAQSRQLMWDDLVATITELQKSGKHVFVLAPIPEIPRPLQQEIAASPRMATTGNFAGVTRQWYEQRNRYVLDHLRQLPWGSDLTLIDPAAILCDPKECNAVIGGTSMYFDADHLSVSGARLVMSQISGDLVSGTNH
ncbi:acyltransferase family protein [Cupriavidus sp. 2SB]|uniref:acyltransferase family protein n=1 Tax=Cupriavidus sp. 2SB TaxID=2502199 RepID=UPI0010F80E4C|nr:acyltransferase family protein [Cupriavidus sp. 2SB]